MSSITIQPVASYWIIGTIMAVVVATLWLGPRFRTLTPVRRRVLLGLRLALVLMLLFALLRPGLVSSVKQQQTGVVAVLVDVSRSMILPHLATGPSRWEALEQAVTASSDAIADLRQRDIDVRFFTLGNRLKPLPSGARPDFSEGPTDSESDLGTALYSVIDSVRDQRLVAILLASDGVQNAADPEIELAQASRLLEESQTPLITVPLGQSVETREFADISVENMADQFSMWVNNDLRVNATVRARGFANQEIPVQLVVTDPDGNEEVVDTVRQLFTRQSEAINVELNYTADRAGQFRLTVRAEPQPGEISPRNNELPGFLTVNEGGLRVLYVYGSLGWEQSYIRDSLGGYRDIQLDELNISQADRGRWPLDYSSLFSDPRYDVFILHDVDARALHQPGVQERNLQALADSVTRGKGLLMMGGYHSFGPGMYARTPLSLVLPLEMEIAEKQDFDAPIRADLHIERDLRPVVSSKHFITQLGDPDENATIWAALPPLAGANRFSSLKDTAAVLLESTAGDPLLVAARIGGRVLAFAGDSTWKWWTWGFEEQHKRFWRQVILWLAFKDNQSGENVRIDLPQRRFQPNTDIRFGTEVNSASNEPVGDARMSGWLTGPDGTRTSLAVLPGGQSRIDRSLVEQAGIYRIEVEATRNDQPLGEAAAEFVVFDNDKETANPAADIDQLKRLSARTSEWGGQMITAEELPATLEAIADLAPRLEIDIPLQWQLGDTRTDALVYVLLFAGLLSVEWWLRKKWGMV